MKRTPIIDVKPIGLSGKGEFMSGRKWKKYNKVKANGKTFKKGQTVHWKDPDFGMHAACGQPFGKEDVHKEYKFKIGGFMKYGNEIDILPKEEKGKNIHTGRWEKTGLGRIPLQDIEEY